VIVTGSVGNFTAVKNVIILIPDGMSVDGTTLARWYNGGQPLAMDEMACGLVRTYSSDTPIADSAPAATAFATGYKSSTGFISMIPDKFGMPGVTPADKDKELSPVATVLEAAKIIGKSVGIVSTSEASHATPAGFSAHAVSRKEMDKIAEQQAFNLIDVIMGGGANYFMADKRADKEDLIKELQNKGYSYISTKEELLKVNTNKLLALFANGAMAYDLDRAGTTEPSLAEMTTKALEILSKNKNGFFLMVEGSEIDWAAHANDPVALISDILAFDNAVKVALDFAKKDKNTIVIVVSDHGNSGITIGNKATSSDYDKRKLEEFLAPLKKAKLTAEGVEKLVKDDMNIDQIKALIAEYYGISDLTVNETEEIAKYFEMKKAKDPKKPYSLAYVLGPMMANRAY
jgi:alkaline phosphatase